MKTQILNDLTHGMYVLTSGNAGCIVDAVMQVSSGEPPIVAVSVMKKNRTNAILKNNDRFALSVLGENVDAKIITTFGFNSSNDVDKFAMIGENDIVLKNGVATLKNSIGYIVCEKISEIDCDTHTLFLGKVVLDEKFSDDEPMTYRFYRERKDELIPVVSKNGNVAWVCTVCGYVFYGENLPDGFVCPICGVDMQFFERRDNI